MVVYVLQVNLDDECHSVHEQYISTLYKQTSVRFEQCNQQYTFTQDCNAGGMESKDHQC